jgi:hypothetical protein
LIPIFWRVNDLSWFFFLEQIVLLFWLVSLKCVHLVFAVKDGIALFLCVPEGYTCCPSYLI